ncbi:gag-pol polyprotein [Cucumis melo var. makuwa]|uniref:Gag-pol polyprotein n=1 Tax=Cucumis melo var. makuwa TaxID=1194695 RepID=A0A5D3CSR4_CUCMM|nr:gag-pol polyprotein [Cucumis melo var. makuwa]TYK13466.1 gag-pol polyprotein [Cucumis melo var. makuwa]
MFEEEAVTDYNERVIEIANECFNLGEKILESKIVRKVLRSLLGKFEMKPYRTEMIRREKGVALKSLYEEETPEHKTTNEELELRNKTRFADEMKTSKENLKEEHSSAESVEALVTIRLNVPHI